MKNIPELKLSKKGNELISFYKLMVEKGYSNDNFNPGRFKNVLKNIFDDFNVKTVLDYGSGRGSWEKKIYNDGTVSALEYFNLDKVYQYEPTIRDSKKIASDCVVCFDVLEHVYICDLKNVVTDLYNHAKKIVVIQVACYNAKAQLPNGENAHKLLETRFGGKGFGWIVQSLVKLIPYYLQQG